MNATRTIWTNTDERVFLEGLGKWGNKPRDRAKLLQNYIEAAKKRKRWGKMHHSGTMAYARNLLKLEGRK